MSGSHDHMIAVGNVPMRWNLEQVVKVLTPYIRGKFTVLDFESVKGNQHKMTKIAYIRLAPHMNVGEVLQRITEVGFKKDVLYGYRPNHIPQAMLSRKGRTIPSKMARRMHINIEERVDVLAGTHAELLRELQTKYLGLYELSANVNHRLLDRISEDIFERLRVVLPMIPRERLTYYTLSRNYRKHHPHDTDFPSIVSHLHGAGEAGAPPTVITEADLLKVTGEAAAELNDIPAVALQVATMKYLLPSSDKVVAHLESLDDEIPQADIANEEQIATAAVRTELKKLAPYIWQIVRDTALTAYPPSCNRDINVRIYGEPYMPNKEACTEFLRQFNVFSFKPNRRLYNCIWVYVSPGQYSKFMAADGTIVGSAKFICRPSKVPLYKVRKEITKKMKCLYGAAEPPYVHNEEEEEEEEGMDSGESEEEF